MYSQGDWMASRKVQGSCTGLQDDPSWSISAQRLTEIQTGGAFIQDDWQKWWWETAWGVWCHWQWHLVAMGFWWERQSWLIAVPSGTPETPQMIDRNLEKEQWAYDWQTVVSMTTSRTYERRPWHIGEPWGNHLCMDIYTWGPFCTPKKCQEKSAKLDSHIYVTFLW